jgi:hypothetical protein
MVMGMPLVLKVLPRWYLGSATTASVSGAAVSSSTVSAPGFVGDMAAVRLFAGCERRAGLRAGKTLFSLLLRLPMRKAGDNGGLGCAGMGGQGNGGGARGGRRREARSVHLVMVILA